MRSDGHQHAGQAVQQPGDGGEQPNPGQNPGELAWFVEQPEADQEVADPTAGAGMSPGPRIIGGFRHRDFGLSRGP